MGSFGTAQGDSGGVRWSTILRMSSSRIQEPRNKLDIKQKDNRTTTSMDYNRFRRRYVHALCRKKKKI
jgi:hypothetical protein